MQFCNFCAKNSEQVKEINENKVKIGSNVMKIQNLLYVFQSDIVKFLLVNKEDPLICLNCLKQLKKCYEFVQQIKESENKLNRGKEIKTEHDYFETTRNVEENETATEKVTVNCERLNNYATTEMFKSNFKFKPILPKAESNEIVKQLDKSLSPKTRLYKCLMCAESFKSFKHLNEHEQEFCKNKFVKDFHICKYCHKCFAKELSLSAHVSLKHSKGEFMCCLCQDKAYAGKGYLARHIEKVHLHESLHYFCGECEELVCMSMLEELREHLLCKHASETANSAVEDPTQAALNDEDMDLEMHEEFLDEFLLAHTNENSFQFSECWEALDLHLPDMLQASAANLHNVPEFKEAFACPKCFEQFKNPQPLLKHLADVHNLPVLICRVCSKCFTSFQDFKRHKLQKCLQNSSLHPLLLECPYCSKSFKNAINLKQHLRIVHCQLKRHICQLCDKQFSTLDHLKKHVLSQHQNERKHVCTVCDKSFTQLGHLKQHLAIHTTGKTFQCSVCKLKFWRKIDLERHRHKNLVSEVCGGK
ncbi:oocyte zinc finger protein XlCOF7.1-like [Calliphora vicina]|uniref:oocyte zinc finger protein XlCOF7.1-like n=1 Tax=Calliphora vicina TaxID=7373 RepID=UPI00325BA0B9